MSDNRKFYCVWRESALGKHPPTKIHETFESARAEVDRLCRQTQDRFFILETVGVVAPTDQPTAYTALSAP